MGAGTSGGDASPLFLCQIVCSGGHRRCIYRESASVFFFSGEEGESVGWGFIGQPIIGRAGAFNIRAAHPSRKKRARPQRGWCCGASSQTPRVKLRRRGYSPRIRGSYLLSQRGPFVPLLFSRGPPWGEKRPWVRSPPPP